MSDFTSDPWMASSVRDSMNRLHRELIEKIRVLTERLERLENLPVGGCEHPQTMGGMAMRLEQKRLQKQRECSHDHLNEEGYCRKCCADRRGI